MRDIKGHPFHIGGRDIEQVDSFSHLGYIITSDFSDTQDIRYRGNRFVGQVNNCLWFFFNKLKCNVKQKLFNTYCSSMYMAVNFGYLVNSNTSIDEFAVAWIVRRVFCLPWHAL